MSDSAVRKLTPARMVDLLGEAAAESLMRHYGGRTIPRLSRFHVEHAERHRRIRAFVAVHGYKAAAAEFGISERQARRHAHGY